MRKVSRGKIKRVKLKSLFQDLEVGSISCFRGVPNILSSYVHRFYRVSMGLYRWDNADIQTPDNSSRPTSVMKWYGYVQRSLAPPECTSESILSKEAIEVTKNTVDQLAHRLKEVSSLNSLESRTLGLLDISSLLCLMSIPMTMNSTCNHLEDSLC